VGAQHSVEGCTKLPGGNAGVIEKHKPLSRPEPLEHRHGLVECDQGRRCAAGLARDLGIGERDEKPVTYGSTKSSCRCQDRPILAEGNLARP
jgi:hypothetical protein